MILYRITAKEYAGLLTASGTENRWNDNGAFVIYTSASASLSCLENLVHLQTTVIKKQFSITAYQLPDKTKIQKIELDSLPADWKSDSSQDAACRLIGRKWYNDKKTLLLCVPSSVIPSEFNYIINTLHPDFQKIKVLQVQPFNFDPRLFKK